MSMFIRNLSKVFFTLVIVAGFSTVTVLAEMSDYRIISEECCMILKSTDEVITIPKGKEVILQKIISDTEAEVSYQNYRGIVERRNLKFEKLYVSATELNLRESPSMEGTILKRIPASSAVTLLSKDHDTMWYKVQSEDEIGYCYSDFLSIEKVIGVYVTPLLGNAGNRNNIRLAANAITGILPKGETFSFIQKIGSTTPERGYQLAPIIVNNKLVDGYGGGVCQVSSTLCGAILTMPCKDEILVSINHTPHTLPSAYIERQYEATIADPYIDFTFTLNHDVKINAYTDESYLYVTVIDLD